MSKNPFPGPQPYRSAERQWFFGRDDLTRQLSGSILANRSVMVHGPSGAGKSSLLQAAVLPFLVEKHNARLISIDGWPEGEEPLAWFEDALYSGLGLLPVSADEPTREKIFRAIRAAARASSRPLVIYLDQIEQLFFTGRTISDTQQFFECLEEVIQMPLRSVRVIVSIREDYMGRLRDCLRDLPRIRENAFRVGPLMVGELVDAVVSAAAAGEPAQSWSVEEVRALMLQVRLPGQSPTDEAEAQSAYAQIICRALFHERVTNASVDASAAEPILERYLESTLAELGSLREKAQLILEGHLVAMDGSRTLRTEKELGRIVEPSELAIILKQLESSAILRAEEHHGSRYFEIGHDWLARRVYKQRQNRERLEEERRQQAEARAAQERENEQARVRLEKAQRDRRISIMIAVITTAVAIVTVASFAWAMYERSRAESARIAAEHAEISARSAEAEANNKAVEASDARLLAGFRELRARGRIADGLQLLRAVEKPAEARNWSALANDGLWNHALEVTLQGPRMPLSMAVWSHDGTRIAAATDYRDICVWNAKGEGGPSVIAAHENAVLSIVWSSDDKHLLTASADGKVHLFDASSLTQKPVVFDAHAGLMRLAVFSPDGKRIAAIGVDRLIWVWRVEGGDPLILRGHSGDLTDIAFMPDGQSIVSASADKTARITSLDGKTSIVLRDHTDVVRRVEPSPDGKFVVTASDDRTARVWDASGHGASTLFAGHRDGVLHATWSPDGTRIATASRDKTGRIWFVNQKEPSIVLSSPETSVASIAFRPDGEYVVTGSFEQTIAVWPVSGGKPRTFDAHREGVTTASWSPDGARVVSAGGTQAKVWRMDHLEGLPRPRRPFFHAAAVLPSGNQFVAAYDDRTVRLKNWDDRTSTTLLGRHDDWVTSVATSPDGQTLATTSLDGTLRLWSSSGAKPEIVLVRGDKPTRAAAFSPDGKRIAVATDDRKVRVWNIERLAMEAEWSGHTDSVIHLVWSPKGTYVASSSLDGTTRLWRMGGTAQPVVLQAHGGAVVGAAWKNDETLIATASDDATVQTWDVSTGEKRVVFDHEGPLLAMEWSSDGKTLVTSSSDNVLRVWKWPNSDEPMELWVNSPIVAMMFTDESKRLRTIAEDNTIRTFTLDEAALRLEMSSVNRDCLAVDKRITYLGEDIDTAEKSFIACERSFQRASARPEKP